MKRYATLVATNGEPTEIAIEIPVERKGIERNWPSLEEQAAIFGEHAETIEQMLYAAMPGGLYDRLLGAMLKRKSSHFIVSHR